MNEAQKQRDAVSLDHIMIAHMADGEAMPESVGDGYAITTTPDGGVQVALHWNDEDGTRRTVIVQGGMLRFFDVLGTELQAAVKAARKRQVVQWLGSLTRERSAAS